MIYVTGDIHGDDSINKMSSRHWPEGRELTFDDYVIICGDFGLWWGDVGIKGDIYWRNWLERKHWTTLWVDGNHENHDLIAELPVEEWCGGRTHVDPRWPHIRHLMRGEVYDIPNGDGTDSRIFAFGGARSHDVEWRTEGVSWWPRELPNLADYENGERNLDAVGWEVDYVITHDAPTETKRALLATFPKAWATDRWEDDRLNGYLDRYEERLAYRKWYFGHYHDDKVVDAKHVELYHQIVALGDNPA